MPRKKQHDNDKESIQDKERKTFYMDMVILQALDAIADRSPADNIKSSLVNVALADTLLPMLDIHEDWKLMDDLIQKSNEYKRAIIQAEADGLQKMKEEQGSHQPPS